MDLTCLSKPFTIAIVGGKLASLILAVGLSSRGILFWIYKATPYAGSRGILRLESNASPSDLLQQ